MFNYDFKINFKIKQNKKIMFTFNFKSRRVINKYTRASQNFEYGENCPFL